MQLKMENGGVGCSVWALRDVQNDLHVSNSWPVRTIPLYTETMEKELLRQLGEWRGCFVIWADNISSRRKRSGQKLHDYLKGRGYHVEQSEITKNPSGSRRVRLYYWYFRKPRVDVSGPPETTRRKAVEKKTKTVSNRITTESGPAAQAGQGEES